MISSSFLAGLLTGIAASALAVLARHAVTKVRLGRPLLMAAAAIAAFALSSAVLYYAVVARHGAPVDAAKPGAVGAAAAQSMQEAVAGLEARLARGGGTDQDWELLARAYDFLGRADDARRARAHQSSTVADFAAGPPGAVSVASLMAAADSVSIPMPGAAGAPVTSGPPSPPAAPTLQDLEERVHDHPGDIPAWLAIAEFQRSRRDNAAARAALERVIALHGMTAQSWADYADVLASLSGGSLGGAAGKAIDQALALEPGNPKALWLKASQAHEQHRFADALLWWQKLRAVLPADSPDTRIIDGNIAEDTQLLRPATKASGKSVAGAAPAASGAEVSGTVSIDGRLASRVQPDATLFIYAKAADAPGPPLAVLRTTTGAWPVAFRLDDSMAMLPSRRLSQFGRVVVEARISRSGQATPGSGDLYVTSPVVSPGTATRLALVIDREVD